MRKDFLVTLTVNLNGQAVTLTDDETSGDNPAFAFNDVKVTLQNMQDQLETIVPAILGVRQR